MLRSGTSVLFTGPALALGAWHLGATVVIRLGMERRAFQRCRVAPVVPAGVVKSPLVPLTEMSGTARTGRDLHFHAPSGAASVSMTGCEAAGDSLDKSAEGCRDQARVGIAAGAVLADGGGGGHRITRQILALR